jgi:hypothetical protein
MRFFRFHAAALTLAVVLAFLLTAPLLQQAAYGQGVAGMTGEVTDPSGAVVPDVVVTLKNATTGLKFTATTNGVGSYRFSEIPPGQGYEAIFVAKGFAPLDVKDIYLTVATIRTQNATLTVGTHAETVEVTAANSEVTIDTTTATIGNTFDVKALNSLPVQQRNDPSALFAMQPGATDSGAVTGSRTDQNFVTVDGLDVNDFATGGSGQGNAGTGMESQLGSIVGHAPVDSVEEFKGGVAGSDASAGLAGGGQFSLVTKGGTNQFHGNLNEYHRDTSLVANSWFSNNTSPIVPRQHYIQNQFGGNFGGPVILPKLFNGHDKLFFFFDFNDSRIIAASVVQRFVPTTTLLAGGITYCTDAACDTTNTLDKSQVNAYDPASIGVDPNWLSFIDKRYPATGPNTKIISAGQNAGLYTFTAPNNNDETNYVGRGDYTINDKMKLFAKFTIVRQNAVEDPNELPGDPVTLPVVDRSYNFVVGHNWLIGANKTNNVYLGDVVQKLSYPIAFDPPGSTAYTLGDGGDTGLAANPYIWPNSSARRIAIEQIGDNFAMISGRHTWQMGGHIEDILAHTTNVSDDNVVEVGLGGHVFSLCGTSADPCSNGNPSLRPSDLNLAGSNNFSWDEPFGFLLGRIGNVTSTYNYNAQSQALKQLTGDQRFYRYYQTQFYLMDSWKVVPGLTISYGVNYQWFSVPYETRGLETVEPFTFNQFFSARVQQSLTGSTTVPLISYLLGGKGNGPNAPPLYNPQYRNFAPHLAFAWNPGFDKKLVINASAGIVYDRTVINAVETIQDGFSYLFQQQKQNNFGSASDKYDSIKNDARLDANNQLSNVSLTAPASPKAPYQPFTGAACAAQNYSPCGLQIGVFNNTIDPALQTPYNMVINFGIQRQMPWDMILKVNYVGRLARKLLAEEDASQVLDFVDPASGESLSTAFASIITQTRSGVSVNNLTVQHWFEDVMTPGVGVANGYANNTAFAAATGGSFVGNGDFGDFVWSLSPNLPPNVGEAAQFANNDFYTSGGFSNYHGLLVTLQKNMSHGLHYDLNYTWSHSIDNVSFFANAEGNTGIGGIGMICDVIRPRECRASSDFDIRQYITTDATYELPVGKGRMFLSNPSYWTNELIGGWDISGIGEWHTGLPWSGASNAYVASFSNDAPPILIGNPSLAKPHLTKLPGGGVSDFSNAAVASQQFEGPVGFHIGPRNSFRGPGFFNADLGLAKNFPITAEKVNLKFRADAFNALNHPNFGIPAENSYNSWDQQDYQQGPGFGQIAFTVIPSGNNNAGARVVQLSLRLEF